MRHLWRRPLKDIMVSTLFIGVVALLVVSGVWAYRQYISSPPYVDPDRYPVRGIDVSRHNGIIDFDKVKASGFDFVFVKATEGVTHSDRLFKRNISEARKAGLKTGAYHFFRFDRDGIEQAQNFLNTVGSHAHALDLGLVIDVESNGNPEGISPEKVKDRLSAMVEYMNLLGHRVMIYTNLDGYYNYMVDVLPGYPLWICGFHENPINAEWTFWQYNHHGKVDGVEGDVDLNAFCGNRKEWDRFLRGDIWPYAAK